MSDVENKLYPEYYGTNPNRRAPNYENCCAEVHHKIGFGRLYQCERKRGYGPDAAYCKQHDPAAKAERAKVATANYRAKMNADRPRIFGPKFLYVLEQIAAGHNDPRALAQTTINEFRKGEHK